MTRRVVAAGLLPLVLAAAAACGRANDDNQVATAGGGATPSATASRSFQEQGLRHARCMRDHGVPEADPVVNADGGVRVGGGFDKSSIDADVLATALTACKQYEPVLGPDEQRAKLEATREEARCMRAHGVED